MEKEYNYTTAGGKIVTLTKDEQKVMIALRRLEKMDFGRLSIFGNGRGSIRFDGTFIDCEISGLSIPVDGGDGGD